jgi:hypothetical protein
MVTVWRVVGQMLSDGEYHYAVLWAGLISVLGALITGHLLHYLQSWEARRPRPRRF